MDDPRQRQGNWHAQYIIVDDLKREKQRLIDEMYKGSVDGFWGVNDNGMTPDEMIEVTLRIEEITRILDAIRLGYYKAP